MQYFIGIVPPEEFKEKIAGFQNLWFTQENGGGCFPPVEEIGKYFELENYTPHLTLGQTHFGMISEELQEMAQKAESELTPNPAFEAPM